MIERAPIGLVAWCARGAARLKYGSELSVDPFGTAHAWQFYRSRWRRIYENLRADRRFVQDTQFAFERRVGGIAPAIPVAHLKQRMARQLAAVEENADDVLSELRMMLAHFERRTDIKIVMMLDTLNPAPFEDDKLAGALGLARIRIEAFARSSRVDLITSVRSAANASGSFIDYGHIGRESTRDRLRHALAGSLAPAIRSLP